MSTAQLDFHYLALLVPSAAGAEVIENKPAIHCFGFRGFEDHPPLIVVWDDVENNTGASATNSIETVLQHLAQRWEHRLAVKSALVIERDSMGDFDHAFPDWTSDASVVLHRQPRVSWKPLHWPGAKPRSEAAFRGMFGNRADQVLEQMAKLA